MWHWLVLLSFLKLLILEVDTQKVELSVKGDKANMNLYGMENKTTKEVKTNQQNFQPKTPPMELRVFLKKFI